MSNNNKNDSDDKYEKIVKLAARRGFFWSSYEIYGGVAGLYDLGPLGVRLKNNIVDLWRKVFIDLHQDIVVEIETPIIAPEIVFKASGHLDSFTDPIVECIRCGKKFRADHLIESHLGIKSEGLNMLELTKLIRENNIKCPSCQGPLGEVKAFNLLFKTVIGPYSNNIGFLRPEAAQGMFVSFKRVRDALRDKFPIGIAQIGKVSRNEISPRQGMIRLREFTIMEIEFFFDPKRSECDLIHRVENRKINILTSEMRLNDINKPESIKISEAIAEKIIKMPWQAYWMGISDLFIQILGIDKENTYFEEKLPHERAHYAQQVFDQMVKVSRWGWVEVSGHAYRTDYDLSRHIKFSEHDLYVSRKLDKPIKIEERNVKIDKAKVIKIYGDKAQKVFRILSSVDLDKLAESLIEKRNRVVIDDIVIDPDIIIIENIQKEVKIEKFIPHVVEPSFGAERLMYIVLDNNYIEHEKRSILRLQPYLAPIQVAVYPLLEKDSELIKKSRSIYRELIANGFKAIYDDSGSIGRRYARGDEIGIPYAITIDYKTLEDDTVTIRFRDTKKQIRLKTSDITSWLEKEIYYPLMTYLKSIY